MGNMFQYTDVKTLIQLNIGAIIVTAFCEIFVIFVFLEKGMAVDIVPWKYWVYLLGLILVSLLFVASFISMFIFVRMKNKRNNAN